MQPNDMASAARALQDCKHADAIFWPPRRVPQTAYLSAYFRRPGKYTARENKSAHGARKAEKRRFILYARIVAATAYNISAIRPFCACIVAVLL